MTTLISVPRLIGTISQTTTVQERVPRHSEEPIGAGFSEDPKTNVTVLRIPADAGATLQLPAEKEAETRSTPLATLKWPRRQHAALTDKRRRLLEHLWSIVLSKALQGRLEISEGIVDVEEDPDEENVQPVLRIYTAATAVQTLAFWDSLAIELDRWLAQLGPSDRGIVASEIGVRFHWKEV